MHKDAWKSLSSKIVYENKWGRKIREHQVVRPTGDVQPYAVLEIPFGVIIIAHTDENEVYLIRLYRFPISQISLEFPAGAVDPGEDDLTAAKRELHEETGMIAENWTKLGEVCFSTGSSNERSSVFLAQGLTQTKENDQFEEGIVELLKVKVDDLLEMIKRNEVVDSSTCAALLLAADHFNIGIQN